MSPPIDIDGSEIQNATIDGQNVNQVTIDGQEVFVGIPDSVIYRWEPADFTQGSPTWNGVVGSETMDLVGDLQAVTLSDGSGGVDADGSDDAGRASILSDVSQGNRTWEFEIQTTATGNQYTMGWRNGSTTEAMFIITNSPNDGDISFFEFDSGNGISEVNHTTSTINDGNIHSVTISITDPSSADVDIIVDGVEDSTVIRSGSAGQSGSGEFGFFGRSDTGTGFSFNGDVSLGTIQFHNIAVTQQFL